MTGGDGAYERIVCSTRRARTPARGDREWLYSCERARLGKFAPSRSDFLFRTAADGQPRGGRKVKTTMATKKRKSAKPDSAARENRRPIPRYAHALEAGRRRAEARDRAAARPGRRRGTGRQPGRDDGQRVHVRGRRRDLRAAEPPGASAAGRHLLHRVDW